MISANIQVKFRVVLHEGYFCIGIIWINFLYNGPYFKAKGIYRYISGGYVQSACPCHGTGQAWKYPDALDAMISLLAADENHSGTYYHLGKLYEQLGEHENALKVYEKGINIADKVKAGNDLRELKGALSQLKDELDQ